MLSLPSNWPLDPLISSCFIQTLTHMQTGLSQCQDLGVFPVFGLESLVTAVASSSSCLTLETRTNLGHLYTWLPSHLPYSPASLAWYLLVITHCHMYPHSLQLFAPQTPGVYQPLSSSSCWHADLHIHTCMQNRLSSAMKIARN